MADQKILNQTKVKLGLFSMISYTHARQLILVMFPGGLTEGILQWLPERVCILYKQK